MAAHDDPESEFERTIEAGGFKWDSVIVFSSTDDNFCLVPIDESFVDQCDLDLSKSHLTEEERMRDFNIKLRPDDIAQPAKVFLRVEDSKYIQFLTKLANFRFSLRAIAR